MSLVQNSAFGFQERVAALVLPLASAGLLLILWQVIVTEARIPEAILPPPLVVWFEHVASLLR